MFNISKEFAPPFKLIVPYFIAGLFFYILGMVAIFLLDASFIHYSTLEVKAWIHLFLLGFVVFIIVGAMAQLIPVVLEIGHFKVEFFYAIFIFLFFGMVLLLSGFIVNTLLLPYAGVLILVGFFIYLLNLAMTLKKVQKFSIVVKSVIIANSFLLFGLIFGFMMALQYAGIISVDIQALLKSHVYMLICGYITITVMGISLVLVPMFGLSHGFNDHAIVVSIYLLSVSVVIVVVSSFLKLGFFEYFGYFLTLVSYGLYLYQMALIYKQRARKESDIWAKSMIFSFFALVLSILFMLGYLTNPKENYLLVSGFLFFMGFLGFIITAHLYKIVPFLVWFHRFSPLVGKQKVPLLVDMVPKKSAFFQFLYTGIGTLLITLGLLFGEESLLKAGATFLTVGALFLLGSFYFMLSFKGK